MLSFVKYLLFMYISAFVFKVSLKTVIQYLSTFIDQNYKAWFCNILSRFTRARMMRYKGVKIFPLVRKRTLSRRRAVAAEARAWDSFSLVIDTHERSQQWNVILIFPRRGPMRECSLHFPENKKLTSSPPAPRNDRSNNSRYNGTWYLSFFTRLL